MKAARTRKTQLAYDRYRKNRSADAPCDFCIAKAGDDVFVTETKHFKILLNRFPYYTWDDHKVAEHLNDNPKEAH